MKRRVNERNGADANGSLETKPETAAWRLYGSGKDRCRRSARAGSTVFRYPGGRAVLRHRLIAVRAQISTLSVSLNCVRGGGQLQVSLRCKRGMKPYLAGDVRAKLHRLGNMLNVAKIATRGRY